MPSAFTKRTAKNLCHEGADGKISGTAYIATSPLSVNGGLPPLPSASPPFAMWWQTAKRGERGADSPLCRLPPPLCHVVADGKEGREGGQIPPFAVCLHPFAMRGQTAKRGERGGRLPLCRLPPPLCHLGADDKEGADSPLCGLPPPLCHVQADGKEGNQPLFYLFLVISSIFNNNHDIYIFDISKFISVLITILK